MSSKHCYEKDLRKLKYGYSLPEILKLKEYVDVTEAMEEAYQKDFEQQQKAPKGHSGF